MLKRLGAASLRLGVSSLAPGRPYVWAAHAPGEGLYCTSDRKKRATSSGVPFAVWVAETAAIERRPSLIGWGLTFAVATFFFRARPRRRRPETFFFPGRRRETSGGPRLIPNLSPTSSMTFLP